MFLIKKVFNIPNYLWLGFLLSIPLFKFFPQIDIYISSLFYQDGIFSFRNTPLESFFYFSIRPIIAIVFLTPLGIYIYNIYFKKNLLKITKRTIIYIVLILALVPGIVVEYGLKKQFERPRPHEVVLFGGEKPFYAAYTFTDEGKKSFSSGHVAAAFSLVGIAMLFRRKRNFFILISISYGFGMMVARVAAGDHFFSDVVTSFFIVSIANLILYQYIIKNYEEQTL